MNDIDRIKAKIKKLLALSGSPNLNEAASALRMAQELMAKYKVDQADVSNIDIGEETAATAYRYGVPLYENHLFCAIAIAFGCKIIYHTMHNKCVWRFIGLRHRARVAAYIGHVLLCKLKNARTKYIKSLYRVHSKYRKTRRADDFCLAWARAVTGKLSSFAGVSDEEQKAIGLYVNKKYTDQKDITSIDRSLNNAVDYLNGTMAGKSVQLQHGVGVHSHGPLLSGA